MGLTQSIKAAQKRKAVRFAIERANGEAQQRIAIIKSADGGLLVHRTVEAAQ